MLLSEAFFMTKVEVLSSFLKCVCVVYACGRLADCLPVPYALRWTLSSIMLQRASSLHQLSYDIGRFVSLSLSLSPVATR